MQENENNEERRDLPAEAPQATESLDIQPEVLPPEPPAPPKPAGRSLDPRLKMLLFRGIIILVSAALALIASNSLVKNTKSAYDTAKAEKSEEVYRTFYDMSFQAAEAEHHVSNDIGISLTSLQEVDKLEVLQVSDVEYVILDKEDNDQNITSWLEVPGTGVFTVDLVIAEYTVDVQRQYVHVRIPRPSLSEFSIDYGNIKQLFWNDDIFNGSVKAGEDLVREQVREGSLLLKQYMTSNRMIYEGASDAAKRMVANLVEQFNPDVPNLTVEVEFIDEL